MEILREQTDKFEEMRMLAEILKHLYVFMSTDYSCCIPYIII